MKHLINLRKYIQRAKYRSERMSRLRGETLKWMQEYEYANTAKHREVCMDMIQRSLRQYEWYGRR